MGYSGALDGIRALAVAVVIAYHAGLAEIPGGFLGVEVFFVVSGFLVTASLLARQSTLEFVWARVLRIYPALLVVVALTVLVLGPAFTTLPLPAYFSAPGVGDYALKCASLIGGIAIHLPGVFETNPYPAAVNGSLWTMPYELRMYLILALVWLGLGVVPGRRREAFRVLVLVIALGAGLATFSRHYLHTDSGYFARFAWMFFSGAACQVLKARIPLSTPIFALGAVALAVSAVSREVFFAAYMLTLTYLVLYLAHIPGGAVRRFNRLGDWSYGVYIYAFPVQQAVVALMPGVSVAVLFLVSATMTLGFAALSWRLVERRALGLKGHFVARSRALVGREAG